jgi:hypothetical protein
LVCDRHAARTHLHCVANFQETRVAFRQSHAQDIGFGGYGSNGLAGPDDRASHDVDAQDPARSRRKHRALGHLFGNDRAFRTLGGGGADDDVEVGLRFIEPRLRAGAGGAQLFGAGEIDPRLCLLRLERGDLGVERRQLQRQLGVADARNDIAFAHGAAFVNPQILDDAADTGAGERPIDAFNGRKDRL